MAQKWTKWLHYPCCLGGPRRFKAGGQYQSWPTNGQCGHITIAALGVPTASKQGGRIRGGPQVGTVPTLSPSKKNTFFSLRSETY